MKLKINFGQYSDKGCKSSNQDFHGVYIPNEPLLSTKGIAIAIADGISSSNVGHIASESAVKSFFDDYYCTADAWSVKNSAHKVIAAVKSWLYAQTQQGRGRLDKDRGFVCTFSAIILKSDTAHIFHVGDTRIYRLNRTSLEQLTTDHRISISPEESYLARALGTGPSVEIDYLKIQVTKNDFFILATDGVYEYCNANIIHESLSIHQDNLDAAAKSIAQSAIKNGSKDNLTIQLIKIIDLPINNALDFSQEIMDLTIKSELHARTELDGFQILRKIHGNYRSNIYLALDSSTHKRVAIKTPSIDIQEDPTFRENFLMEEWIARRIQNDHVLKAAPIDRKKSSLYTVMEFIEGQTLAQWMIDNPRPSLEKVRNIVDQIAKGLAAFHRLEMIHQDIRPENIMIDKDGTIRIIDFGATSVASIKELRNEISKNVIPGTLQYTAPEYFTEQAGGSIPSDIFSLACITYQMLTGRLPFGLKIPKIRKKRELQRLRYLSANHELKDLPIWVDRAIEKGLHFDSEKRYQDVLEFAWDLRHPNSDFLNHRRMPLIERNPLVFWQLISLGLLLIIIALIASDRISHIH